MEITLVIVGVSAWPIMAASFIRKAARRFYNGNVRDYRNLCEGFPSNLVGSFFDFERQDFFNVDPSVREAPSVQGLS
jgi:hypothetical protein